MRCQNCNKKCSVPIKCLYCGNEHCMKCVHLEKHNCSGKEEKIKKELINLEKKIEYKPPSKYELLCKER